MSETSDSILLESLSSRDSRFDLKRCQTEKFRDLYRNTVYDRLSEKLQGCAPRLGFSLKADEAGTVTLKLHSARFCRERHCPMCQWRRSKMWLARVFKLIPMVLAQYSKSRFIFMTLTVRNCEVVELRQTLSWMHKAWTKLVKRKEFADVQGWARTVEVTRGADDTAHPHYHVLIMVSSSYFSRGYVSQAKWTQAWKEALQIEYTPIVDVRSVKPGKTVEEPQGDMAMLRAVLETFKYSVKPSDCLGVDRGLLSNQNWLVELTTQLKGTKAIAVGGVLKQYLKEIEKEPEDLIHADEVGESESDQDNGRLVFGWRERLGHYVYDEQFARMG